MKSRITIIAVLISLTLTTAMSARPRLLSRIFGGRTSEVTAPATADPYCTGPNCNQGGTLTVGQNNSINTPSGWQPGTASPVTMGPSVSPNFGSLTLPTARPLQVAAPPVTMAYRATTGAVANPAIVASPGVPNQNTRTTVQMPTIPATPVEAQTPKSITQQLAELRELQVDLEAQLEYQERPTRLARRQQPVTLEQDVQSSPQTVDVKVGPNKTIRVALTEVTEEDKDLPATDSVQDVIQSFPTMKIQHVNAAGYVEMAAEVDIPEVLRGMINQSVPDEEECEDCELEE